jgi:AcrR family transcriptional regulator
VPSPPRSAPRRRRAPAEARREILDGAAAFLRERPWRELTVQGVMDRTTLSRASFYLHFDDRLDLLGQLAEDLAIRLADRPDRRRWLADPEGSLEVAREAIDGLVQIAVAEGPLIRALYEASHQEPGVEAAREALERRFADATQAWIEAQMEAGRAPAGDARLLAESLTMLTREAIVGWFGGAESEDPEAVAAVLLRQWGGAVFGSTPGWAAGG